jgi:hypothetical protein
VNRTLSALLVSGGLATAAAPVGVQAHDPDLLAGFIAGAAVGVLLTEAGDHHSHHHVHAYQQPVYVVPPPVAYYAAPAPRVRYYPVVETPRGYHKPKHHKHWKHDRRRW